MASGGPEAVKRIEDEKSEKFLNLWFWEGAPMFVDMEEKLLE